MSLDLPGTGPRPTFPSSSDMPLLAGLNTEQRAAVTLPAEPALILAGAGSGKTRVLTTRIAWLLQTGQISPGGLLAVTFTNKAAREMMTRLQSMLPVNVRGMWIGTFHGLCNRLLRAHHKTAGLPQTFQILDTQDQQSAIKRLCKQFNVDEERFPPKQLQWFIGGCKEDGLRPGDVQAHDPDTRKKVELYQLYEEQCQREGVVDFGELLLRSYELLRDHAPVREHYQRRFRHILIDEFQDTNKLQYAWIKLLAGQGASHENAVFAVGDDDQSIYAFRGARVGNMADFVREFHVQHQIKLEQNYRSYSNILDSANALISHNKHRLGKNLRTEQGAGEPVRVVESSSDFAEAQWLIDEIKQLIRDDSSAAPGRLKQASAPLGGSEDTPVPSVGANIARKEMAVLYRSNAQSRVIETALFNSGIPYKVYGGLRFFERAEIKHALAYLRLLENPNDDTSFLRVVNFPPRGIGARSIEQLQDAARAANQGAGSSLHAAVNAMSGKAGANLSAFVAKIDVLREQTQGLTLREIIELVLEHSGLVEHYRAEREGADRIENLEELVTAAESFVSIEGFGRDAEATAAAENAAPDADGEVLSPLAAFLTHAALEAGDNQAQDGQDAVQLMTVHASKGLEFDVVFITGLEEGLFPHENSLSDFDGLEEERRLMYVAITRARKRLYLSLAQTRMLHGQTRYHIRSRFLDELPEETLKWVTPRNQGFGSGFTPQNSYGPGRGNGAGGGAWNSGWANASRSDSAYGRDTGSSLSSSKVVEQAQEAATGLRIGMSVFHNKFGEGKVLTLEGSGDDARAQINFPRHGVKWLALSVAKLTVV
ncbi:UvrD-helicase domain-containing protein [Hylemonella gracilis]|nr:UvrD-helicase domain-containing protein [Hylemonella gracilis]